MIWVFPTEQLQQTAGGHYGGESLRKLLLYILTGATVGSQPQLQQWALALRRAWLHKFSKELWISISNIWQQPFIPFLLVFSYIHRRPADSSSPQAFSISFTDFFFSDWAILTSPRTMCCALGKGSRGLWGATLAAPAEESSSCLSFTQIKLLGL